MNKVKLEILGLSASHSGSGSFALVLGEVGGSRRLPIIIGMFEAQAIAIEMEKIQSNRPMTHDLFKSFALHFEVNVSEIVISDLKEGVFFARIVCKQGEYGETIEIDSRPSDAVAIGLRFNVPIMVTEKVMKEAGIEISDLDAEEEENQPESDQDTAFTEKTPVATPTVEKAEDPSDFSSKSIEDLESLMQQAIDDENYEKAASIRDEINKRK